MDIATLLGLVIGIVVVAGAVLSGSDFWVFLNLPGILIVLGGTFAATLIKFPIAMVFVAFKVGLRAAFGNAQDDAREIIEQAGEFARLARKDGFLALEDADVGNEFFRKGIQLCVDGIDIDLIRATLTSEMNLDAGRQEVGERIFRAIGDSAPAFGMIGTLVGLVQMLSTMEDPSTIGPAMAIALLTTLYGALIANLVALPIAEKLETKADQDRLTKSLIIEAIVGIHGKQNPDVLIDFLEVYLPENKRHHDEVSDGSDRQGASAPAAAGNPA
jgi:chemotaxis protein MotA